MFSRVARPLLAAVSVANGVEDLLNPKPKIEVVAPLLAKITPGSGNPGGGGPTAVNPALVVQAGAAVKITAGLLMGLGRMPRLAAIVLAADLIPTTVAGHPFSAAGAPDARKARQANFLSNCGLLGGLLLASTVAGRKRKRR